MLQNCVIQSNKVTVLKGQGKPALADVKLPLQNDVSHGIRWCNIVLALERCYKYMSANAKKSNYIAKFLQCKGGKLEEAEDFKYVFVVYRVFE